MIIELTDLDFEQALRDARGPVLVDFYAPWCHPCHLQLPVVNELAEEVVGQFAVYKVNVDQSPVIVRRYGIQSLPTLLVFRHGEIGVRLIGLQSKQSLRDALQQSAASKNLGRTGDDR